MKKIAWIIFCSILIIGVIGDTGFNVFAKEENNIGVKTGSIAILSDCESGKKYICEIPAQNQTYKKSASLNNVQGGDSFTIESEIQVTIPENNDNKPMLLANTTSREEYDGSRSWKGYIKSTYKKSGSKYLLTQTNGNWKCYDTSVKISGRKVTYGCGSSQVATKKPTSNSFKYSTGFKKYITGGGWNVIGSNSFCYLKRGTGKKWKLEVIANL